MHTSGRCRSWMWNLILVYGCVPCARTDADPDYIQPVYDLHDNDANNPGVLAPPPLTPFQFFTSQEHQPDVDGVMKSLIQHKGINMDDEPIHAPTYVAPRVNAHSRAQHAQAQLASQNLDSQTHMSDDATKELARTAERLQAHFDGRTARSPRGTARSPGRTARSAPQVASRSNEQTSKADEDPVKEADRINEMINHASPSSRGRGRAGSTWSAKDNPAPYDPDHSSPYQAPPAYQPVPLKDLVPAPDPGTAEANEAHHGRLFGSFFNGMPKPRHITVHTQTHHAVQWHEAYDKANGGKKPPSPDSHTAHQAAKHQRAKVSTKTVENLMKKMQAASIAASEKSSEPAPTATPRPPVMNPAPQITNGGDGDVVDVVYVWTDPIIKSFAADWAVEQRLMYSLRSISQFARWVRRIYVAVPAERKFVWLDEGRSRGPGLQLRVVRHEEFIPPGLHDKLPTQNRFMVASFINFIPELAEKFIYMPDGMFFGADVAASDFYSPDGSPRFGLASTVSGADTVLWPTATPFDWAVRETNKVLDGHWGMSGMRAMPMLQPYALTRGLFTDMHAFYRKAFESTAADRTGQSHLNVVPHFLALWSAKYLDKAVELSKTEIRSHMTIDLETSDGFTPDGAGDQDKLIDQQLRLVLATRPKSFALRLHVPSTKLVQVPASVKRVVLKTMFPRRASWEKNSGASYAPTLPPTDFPTSPPSFINKWTKAPDPFAPL